MYLYLKQRVFSIGEKFTFYDERQIPVFTARGSFFAIPKHFELLGANGRPLILIERRFFTFFPTYEIYALPERTPLAYMKKRFSLTQSFKLEINGEQCEIAGSIFGYSFDIIKGGRPCCSVRKRFISWGDTYEINIDESVLPPTLACAIIVAVDNAVHNGSSNSHNHS